MQSIYDFPDVYDAVLRSSAEQIKNRGQFHPAVTDQGHNQRQRPRTRLWDMWTWNFGKSVLSHHLKKGGLYIIVMDKHYFTPPISETGIWGEKTVRMDNGYVEVWHEDFPGDWVEGIKRMVMHCRIHVNDTICETTDDWRLRYYSPWLLSLFVQTLPGWSLKGFYSRRDLSQDIAEQTHYFTVLEKAY